MGLLSRKHGDAAKLLDRIEKPSDEPEVIAAAEARGRAEVKAEELARELAALTDRIGAAEREMASSILDGESTDGGEDLPSLRLARRELRESYDLIETVAELARERLQEARSTAQDRLRGEFERLYRKAVKELVKELDEALVVNVLVRDLEARARELKVAAPTLFYHGLTPATPTYHSRFADWRAEIDLFLKGKTK